jgi:hypothetical protein
MRTRLPRSKTASTTASISSGVRWVSPKYDAVELIPKTHKIIVLGLVVCFNNNIS